MGLGLKDHSRPVSHRPTYRATALPTDISGEMYRQGAKLTGLASLASASVLLSTSGTRCPILFLSRQYLRLYSQFVLFFYSIADSYKNAKLFFQTHIFLTGRILSRIFPSGQISITYQATNIIVEVSRQKSLQFLVAVC